ncbi:hypothetical protein [Paenarthrobacter ureafaciens]|uniref:hypothetical protein n=1 Tax=Paenarthrobacter ureafaciens TaxID=37931 RepID=UPI001F44C282|nr:hypothetical protein [Paenarthrobacter ureafaciens]
MPKPDLRREPPASDAGAPATTRRPVAFEGPIAARGEASLGGRGNSSDQGRNPSKVKRGPDSLKGTIIKIVLLGLVDALAVYVLMMLFLSQSWAALSVSSVVVLAINWIYLRKGGLPAKYGGF